MYRIITAIAVMLLSQVAMAHGEFPEQPVAIAPGYGSEGAGNHSAIPFGRQGEDCVVSPFAWDFGPKEIATTKLVPGDIVSIPTRVLFDFDGDIVRPEGELDLQGVYQRLTEAGATELKVIGHTDSKGTEEYNEGLGLRRALAVAAVLKLFGFDASSIESGGELFPVAPNANDDGSDNPEGRQQNRRVDIEILAVEEVEVEEITLVEVERNPLVFHVLSSGGTVNCGYGAQDRLPQLLWRNNGFSPSFGRQFGQQWF